MIHVKPDDVLSVLSKYMLVDGFDIVIDLEKSHGSYMVDARDGSEYLDFFSFFATNPLGFNHPKMTTEEFKQKLVRASIQKPSNSDFYTVEMAEFVETFFQIAVPDYFKYVFFIDGGALAVENALKAAFDWKVRKNFAKGYTEEKGHQVIHFMEAFHGRSGYTLSLTNTADPRKTQYFAKFNWPRVLNPKITFPLTLERLEEVKAAEDESIRQINEAIENNPDDIAAIIIEPIQGEGGDNHFRPEFFKQLRTLADENDILLIFDEVQTGVGLTGKMWAHEHFGVQPDILVFGKKTQVCGILVTDRIDEVENNVFKESSRINSTWGGNLTDMVRSQRYFEIIAEDNLVDHAAKMGAYFFERMQALEDEFPELISNVRAKGLFAAFTLPNEAIRDRVFTQAHENKVIVLKSGHDSIRFRPPLTIQKNEIDQGFSVLRSVMKSL
ncbi:MAG: L-lysine 6-transaminase [Calditrichaeota bacterium]|nr:L-lysine 6-transaminase [Calditrichota bacterium]